MARLDPDFARDVAADVKNLRRCYQCSMCSDGCPVAAAMDLYPHELIALLRHGMADTALGSKSIWTCVSCHTCAARCPNEVDIVHFMDVLRRRSLREGVNPQVRKAATFHQQFVETIVDDGRVDTLKLLMRYQLRTRDFLSSTSRLREQAGLGLEMLRKGKLKLAGGPPGVGKGAVAAVRRLAGAGTVKR